MIKELLQSSVSDIIRKVIFYMTLGRLLAFLGSIAASGLVKMDEILHSKGLSLFSSDCIGGKVNKLITSADTKTSDSDYIDISDSSHEGSLIRSNPDYGRKQMNDTIETATSHESPLSEESNAPSLHVVAVVVSSFICISHVYIWS
jgi:hypothetical protein